MQHLDRGRLERHRSFPGCVIGICSRLGLKEFDEILQSRIVLWSILRGVFSSPRRSPTRSSQGVVPKALGYQVFSGTLEPCPPNLHHVQDRVDELGPIGVVTHEERIRLRHIGLHRRGLINRQPSSGELDDSTRAFIVRVLDLRTIIR